MTEDIKSETIKKTQDALAKYIKKPVLSEKLLKKPPFRFLHDIVTNVIRETGFLKGLFTHTEMISENMKDKESKIVFLQRLIDCLKIVTGITVSARPNKIVAGLEPAKTNELLQIIAYALHKNLDSSAAIQQLQKGTTKPKVKSKDEKKVELKTIEKSNKSISTPRTNKTTEEKLSSRKSHEKVKDSSRTRVDKVKSSKSQEELKKSKSITKIEKKDSKTKDTSPRTPKGTKEKLPTAKLESELLKTQDGKTDKLTIQDKKKIITETQDQTDTVPENLIDTNNPLTDVREEKHLNLPHNEKIIQQDIELISNENMQKQNTLKEVIQKENKMYTETPNTSTNEKSSQQDAEVMKSKENSKKNIAPRPKTSLRPPSVRPSSARPGAPRLKDRNDIILPPDELIPMGKVNVIVENFSQHDDDNEETVVMETAVELPVQEPPKQTTDIPAEKGHLVAQILEQLGDNVPQESEFKSKVEVDWNTGNERNRATANKEMEKLRESIQTLTRAANPLGKLMNFLQEDVDSMRSELKMWIDVNKKLSGEIKIMAKINGESIQPVREQLEHLDEDITKQHEQISNTRASILRNEQKIKMLLIRET